MACARSPQQLLREAKTIAKEHNLRIAEIRTPTGTDYVLYRVIPGGGDTRVGKRATPAGIRKFVADCAGFK